MLINDRLSTILTQHAGEMAFVQRSQYIAGAFADVGARVHIVDLDISRATSNSNFSDALVTQADVAQEHEVEHIDRVIVVEAKEKGLSEQVRTNYTRSCLMRALISAQDVADMAIFLASTQASKITGQIMNVGGYLKSYVGMDDPNICNTEGNR